MKIRLPSRMKFNYLLQSFIFNQAYVISQGVPWISKRSEFEYVANLNKQRLVIRAFHILSPEKKFTQSFLFYGPHFFFSFHSKSILTWKSHSQKMKKLLGIFCPFETRNVFQFQAHSQKMRKLLGIFVLAKLKMCFGLEQYKLYLQYECNRVAS